MAINTFISFIGEVKSSGLSSSSGSGLNGGSSDYLACESDKALLLFYDPSKVCSIFERKSACGLTLRLLFLFVSGTILDDRPVFSLKP